MPLSIVLVLTLDVVSATVAIVCELVLFTAVGLGPLLWSPRTLPVWIAAPLTGHQHGALRCALGRGALGLRLIHVTEGSVQIGLATTARVIAIAPARRWCSSSRSTRPTSPTGSPRRSGCRPGSCSGRSRRCGSSGSSIDDWRTLSLARRARGHRRSRRDPALDSARRSPCSCSRSGGGAPSRRRWRREDSGRPAAHLGAHGALRAHRMGGHRGRMPRRRRIRDGRDRHRELECHLVVTRERMPRARLARPAPGIATASRRPPRCAPHSRRPAASGTRSCSSTDRAARASRPSRTPFARWPGAAPSSCDSTTSTPAGTGLERAGDAARPDARAPASARRRRALAALGLGPTGRVARAGAPGRALIIEGCGAFAAGAAAPDAVRIWVDAPDAVRRRRALDRDAGAYDPYWDLWERQWRRYVHRTAPERHAGVRLRAAPDAGRAGARRGRGSCARPIPRANVVA